MARRLLLEIIGDPARLFSSLKKSSAAVNTFGAEVKHSQTQIGLSAEQSTKKIIEASVVRDRRLRQEILAARQLSTTYARGSAERAAADNLVIQKEKQLARALSVTSAEAAIHNRNVAASERNLGRATRGALAGSGAFAHLGRSLAFASGGFLAFASASTLIRRSVDEAMQAAATERQLTTQFAAGGLDFDDYREKLEAATIATSRLSGFTRDQLLQSFLQAFRGSRDFGAGLKLMEASADAARGTGKGLNVVTLALTKAFLGQTGAARRLGILIPANVKGVAALDFVMRRFRGQAEAGTTEQQRFAAALQLTQISIGQALLPEVDNILDKTADWLLVQKNQERVQRDVVGAVKAGTDAIRGLYDIFKIAEPPIRLVTRALGGFEHTVVLLLEALAARKLLAFANAEGLIAANADRAAASIAGMNAAAAEGGAAGAAGAAGGGAAAAERAALGGGILGGLAARFGPLGSKALKIGGIVGYIEILRQLMAEQDKLAKSHKSLLGEFAHDLRPTPFFKGLASNTVAAATLGQVHIFQPKTEKAVSGVDAMERALKTITTAIDTIGDFIAEDAGRVSKRLGFKAHFAKEELALAQAQLTTGQDDDRKVLAVEAQLIRERIKRLGNATKTLAERTQLTQQLVSIEGEITQIDQQSFQSTIRFKRLELALAQASLTQTQSDDRKILQVEAAAIRERLSTIPKTKATLDARIALTQQLAGIEGQISTIDQEAKQKQLDALDKQRQSAQNHLSKIRDKESQLRSKIKEITDALAQTIETVRGQIGELFSGPVLQPTERQLKAALGVRFEDLDPKALTRDLNAQVKAFSAFEHGLAQLARRGAPKELLKELQAQGLAAAPEVQALAAASPADLRAFFKAFGKRERLAIQSARTEMKAQLVTLHADRVALRGLRQQEVKVEIEIKGINKRDVRVRTRRTTTAGGRNAGR